jgi:hypothetical protein
MAYLHSRILGCMTLHLDAFFARVQSFFLLSFCEPYSQKYTKVGLDFPAEMTETLGTTPSSVMRQKADLRQPSGWRFSLDEENLEHR